MDERGAGLTWVRGTRQRAEAKASQLPAPPRGGNVCVFERARAPAFRERRAPVSHARDSQLIGSVSFGPNV